jgi:hypothetical protein
MCPLWWKSTCELQEMYGIQGPIKGNIPNSQFENMQCYFQTVHIFELRVRYVSFYRSLYTVHLL